MTAALIRSRADPPGSDLAPLTFTHADHFVARLAELCRERATGSKWIVLRSRTLECATVKEIKAELTT